MNPLTLDALRKTIRKVVSGNRAQPERTRMKVYIVQRESMVGNEIDCFTSYSMAQEWATLVRSHVQVEETMDERLPEFIETYKRLPVVEPLRTYYECGICGHNHPVEWNGDC